MAHQGKHFIMTLGRHADNLRTAGLPERLDDLDRAGAHALFRGTDDFFPDKHVGKGIPDTGLFAPGDWMTGGILRKLCPKRPAGAFLDHTPD